MELVIGVGGGGGVLGVLPMSSTDFGFFGRATGVLAFTFVPLLFKRSFSYVSVWFLFVFHRPYPVA